MEEIDQTIIKDHDSLSRGEKRNREETSELDLAADSEEFQSVDLASLETEEETFEEILSLALPSYLPPSVTSANSLPSDSSENSLGDATSKRRESNREYARKSRMRKKMCVETLHGAVRFLQRENDHLKALLQLYGVFYAGLPPPQT